MLPTCNRSCAPSMNLGMVMVAALLVIPGAPRAQTVRSHVIAADSQFAAKRLGDALELYEHAMTLDSLAYDAAAGASLAAVTLGEFHSEPEMRAALYAKAARYARRAVSSRNDKAEAHYLLARALGRTALSVGVRERTRFAVEIRDEAMTALALDPNHAGARHVLGLWHQNVMQLSSLQRFAARRLLGAKVFGEASWGEAVRNLEMAVALEPNTITHRLDLGRLYAARKKYEQAREQLRWVLSAPSLDYNDDAYRREAEAALRSLRDSLQ
jgi:tetratricopeptide (TPR) repeat protein